MAGLMGSGWATHNQSKSANRNLKAVQNAKEDAYRRGIERQDGYAAEAGSAFRPMVENQGGDSFRTQLAENTAGRMEAFGPAESEASDYSIPGSTSKNVAMAMEQAFGEEDEKTNRNRSGLAKLGGYGDTSLNQGFNRNSFARAFGNLSDTALRDSNLIGMDMQQAANNAYKGPNTSLSLAKAGSQLAAQYAAAGMPGMPGMGGGAPVNRGADGTPIPVMKPKQQAFGGYGPNFDTRG